MRKINADGLRLIKQWEGLRTDAYKCPGDVWTIGYGHTRTARPGMSINPSEAEALLKLDLVDAQEAVERLVKVPLSDHQFAAMVSFTFNLGAGNLAKSTLLRRLNAGEYDAVPTELAKWVNAGGKRLQGLVNRRAAEAGLWAKGAHVAGRDVQAESGDRASPAFSTTLQSVAGSAVAGGGMVVTGVSRLDGAAQLVMVAGGLLLAGFLVWIARERLRKWAEGDR